MVVGPNVKALIIRKMSIDMVPDDGGFSDGLKALTDGSLSDRAREAREWVEKAIHLIKISPNNTFGDNDEDIAAVLLEEVDW